MNKQHIRNRAVEAHPHYDTSEDGHSGRSTTSSHDSVISNYLGRGTRAIPSDEKPLHLLMKQRNSGSSWRCDSYTISTPDGRPYAGGFRMKEEMSGKDVRHILRDGKGYPVAVCVSAFSVVQKKFRIYGLRPIYPDQKPSRRFAKEGVKLYKWAEVKHISGSSFYTMNVWNGEKYIKAYKAGSQLDSETQERIEVIKNEKKCATLRRGVQGMMQGHEWKLSIKPQTDPCLMFCLVTLIDELKLLEGKS